MDPILGTVEGAALTQGVIFLYTQAGELLKRRREARDRARERSEQGVPSAPALEPPEAAFAYPAATPGVALERVEDDLDELREAREALELAVHSRSGGIQTDDERLALVQLRAIMERIYGADLTFVGEGRDQTRSQVDQSRTLRAKTVKAKYLAMGDISGVTEH